MKYEDAMEKAKTPMVAKDGTNAYEIHFEQMESANGLIGKTLTNEKKGNVVVVSDWVGQNYVVKVGDEYYVQPVVFVLSLRQKGVLTVS